MAQDCLNTVVALCAICMFTSKCWKNWCHWQRNSAPLGLSLLQMNIISLTGPHLQQLSTLAGCRYIHTRLITCYRINEVWDSSPSLLAYVSGWVWGAFTPLMPCVVIENRETPGFNREDLASSAYLQPSPWLNITLFVTKCAQDSPVINMREKNESFIHTSLPMSDGSKAHVLVPRAGVTQLPHLPPLLSLLWGTWVVMWLTSSTAMPWLYAHCDGMRWDQRNSSDKGALLPSLTRQPPPLLRLTSWRSCAMSQRTRARTALSSKACRKWKAMLSTTINFTDGLCLRNDGINFNVAICWQWSCTRIECIPDNSVSLVTPAATVCIPGLEIVRAAFFKWATMASAISVSLPAARLPSESI